MPSKNMLPKGQRRRTVKPAYREARSAVQDAEREAARLEALGEQPVAEVIPEAELEDEGGEVRSFTADKAAKGLRLDAYLAQALPEVSRARLQGMIEAGQVRVNGLAVKASTRLTGRERVELEGEPRAEPLHAEPEHIPLDVVFEDEWLAVINKPAGMVVHPGAGVSSGTLVNALLWRFGQALSSGHGAEDNSGEGNTGAIRPGIVHRLDRETSGLLVVAKDDETHRRLGDMFARREVDKEYLALLHGTLEPEEVTVSLPVARDTVRRTRMTVRRSVEGGARPAVSHFRPLERIAGAWGRFTLAEVAIETGRTHQIRVHAESLRHSVVGDTTYGAPRVLRNRAGAELEPGRNFLHAARLRFRHPRTREALAFSAELPPELTSLLETVRAEALP